MARYTDTSKERVKDSVDMLALVGQYTDLRKSGPVNYKGLCPFHDERTPSFNVNVDEKFFKCFGCGEGGDALTFVQKKEGLDFVGSLEHLAERFGVELEVEDEDPRAAQARARQARLGELLSRTADFYVRHLWESKEASHARAYLTERGMDEALLREFRVGYAPRKWDAVLIPSRRAGYTEQDLLDVGLVIRSQKGGAPYDRFRARITFPLCDRRGRVMGFGARRLAEDDKGPKYLNSNDGPLFHKGKNVYASDIARAHATKAGQVILAEGYTDVIALHQAGLRNTVGLMGTSLTTDQVTELARLASVVVLALDADSAGQEAMLRAAQVAAGRKVQLRVVKLPAGMDPADLVQAEGADAMRRLVDESVPFVSFRVHRTLETANLMSSEGRDEAFGALKPVLDEVPAGALREELVRVVADRTDMPASVIERELATRPVVAPRAPASSSSLSSRPAGGAPQRPAGPRQQLQAAQPRVAGADPRDVRGQATQPNRPPQANRPAQPVQAPRPTGTPGAGPTAAADRGTGGVTTVLAGEGWEGMDALEPHPDELDPGAAPDVQVPTPATPPSAATSQAQPARAGAPAQSPAAAVPTPEPADGPVRDPMPDGPHARMERALLIQVIAQPAIGRPALIELGGPDAFIPGVHQRAAAHLLTHDGPPMATVDESDPVLASLMAGLVIRATEQATDAATLEAEVLKLKLAAVDRQMRRAPKGEVPALARERQQLQIALREAIGRHMDASDTDR
ncbi:DNA primase [Paraconexibacter sp. AEG42_29]|uniref:DNA primase n=1 Tax=Paraconexibacter sp. AEG42_29 TaxID=2997339 RepID=A0AAU7AWU2_9ACTN